MSTVQSLRASLEELGFSPYGNKKVLKRRLHRARKITAATSCPSDPSDAARSSERVEGPWTPTILTFLVVDIEATCESGSPRHNRKQKYDYPSEIIEFPVVVLRWTQRTRTYEMTNRFHRFVRPIWRPQLSSFCKVLTGVNQRTIEEAQEWPAILWELYTWLKSQGLLVQRNEEDSPDQYRLAEGVCWATHGPEDLAGFVSKQSWIAARSLGESFPDFGPRCMRGLSPLWLRGPLMDIRKAFCLFTRLVGQVGGTRAPRSYGRQARRDLTIDGILGQLGMEFEGRQHSGLCDAENLGRILIDIARRVRDENAKSPIPGGCSENRKDGDKDAISALSNELEAIKLASCPVPGSPLPPLLLSPAEAEAVLKPNANGTSHVQYAWMTRPGQVDWPHPPEP